MDYSKLSDFEINCDVLSVLSPDIKHMCLSGDNSCFYECGPTGDGWNQIDIPDYCNNPADAWPIIEANRISLRNRYEGDWKAENEWGESHFHISRNLLRAAMVVFLMMQDARNEK